MTEAIEEQILARLDKLERRADRHDNRLLALELADKQLTASEVKGAMRDRGKSIMDVIKGDK